MIKEFKEGFVKTPLGKLMLTTVSADAAVLMDKCQKLSTSPLFKPMEEYLLSQKDKPFLKFINIINPFLNINYRVLNASSFSSNRSTLRNYLFQRAAVLNASAPLVIMFSCAYIINNIPLYLTTNFFPLLLTTLMGTGLATPLFMFGIFAILSQLCGRASITPIGSLGKHDSAALETKPRACLKALSNEAFKKITINCVTFIIFSILSIFFPFYWLGTIISGLGLLFNYKAACDLKKDSDHIGELSSYIVQAYPEFDNVHRSLSDDDKVTLYKQIEDFKRILTLK